MNSAEFENLRGVQVRLVRREELGRWKVLMDEYHYLGCGVVFGESLQYVATLNGEWVALVGWGSAALKVGVRDQWIGWNAERKYRRLRYVVNNVRFLVLPECRIKNLASRVLGLNLRRLNSDWWERHGHRIVLVETFVDEQRNRGTCYLAAGWTLLGRTRGFGKSGNGYMEHGNPKLVYVKSLHSQAQDILCSDFPHPYCLTSRDTMDIDLNAIDFDGPKGLKTALMTITDPRKRRGVRHRILPILAVAACATLAGMRSYTAMAQWTKALPNDLLRKLGFRLGIPPSEPTLRRVLQKLDEGEFNDKVSRWFTTYHAPLKGRAIAVDGKTLRGAYDGDKETAPHLLSALTHDDGVVLAQIEVGKKTNEIPEVKRLLRDLPLTDAIVTMDAMHTQVNTAEFIVDEKKADYLFTVKENQPTLLNEIRSLPDEAFSPCGDLYSKRSRSH